MSFLTKKFNQLVDKFIRPGRKLYNVEDLAVICNQDHQYAVIKGVPIVRQDFSIRNYRRLILKGSLWKVENDPCTQCVIFLHPNQGCRAEALELVYHLAPKSINLVAFDFAGSGMSEGDFITLGWNEQRDVECIIQFLKRKFGFGQFILYGRSMGAVAGLLYLARIKGAQQHAIAGIFDSPYTDLLELVDQLSTKNTILPGFVVDVVMSQIEEKIEETIGKNIFEDYVGKIKVPGFFITGLKDKLVPCRQVYKNYDYYGGPKYLQEVNQGHNQRRPKQVMEKISSFIKQYFQTQNYPSYFQLRRTKFQKRHISPIKQQQNRKRQQRSVNVNLSKQQRQVLLSKRPQTSDQYVQGQHFRKQKRPISQQCNNIVKPLESQKYHSSTKYKKELATGSGHKVSKQQSRTKNLYQKGKRHIQSENKQRQSNKRHQRNVIEISKIKLLKGSSRNNNFNQSKRQKSSLYQSQTIKKVQRRQQQSQPSPQPSRPSLQLKSTQKQSQQRNGHNQQQQHQQQRQPVHQRRYDTYKYQPSPSKQHIRQTPQVSVNMSQKKTKKSPLLSIVNPQKTAYKQFMFEKKSTTPIQKHVSSPLILIPNVNSFQASLNMNRQRIKIPGFLNKIYNNQNSFSHNAQLDSKKYSTLKPRQQSNTPTNYQNTQFQFQAKEQIKPQQPQQQIKKYTQQILRNPQTQIKFDNYFLPQKQKEQVIVQKKFEIQQPQVKIQMDLNKNYSTMKKSVLQQSHPTNVKQTYTQLTTTTLDSQRYSNNYYKNQGQVMQFKVVTNQQQMTGGAQLLKRKRQLQTNSYNNPLTFLQSKSYELSFNPH